MGLDLVCDDMHTRVGSYSTVQEIRKYLLLTVKNYIMKTKDIYNFQKEDLIKEFNRILPDLDSNINYKDYEILSLKLKYFNLDGFDCFINHSDCQGFISSYQSYQFIKTLNIVKKYFDKNIYHYDNKFFLLDIFLKSSETEEDIYFT